MKETRLRDTNFLTRPTKVLSSKLFSVKYQLGKDLSESFILQLNNSNEIVLPLQYFSICVGPTNMNVRSMSREKFLDVEWKKPWFLEHVPAIIVLWSSFTLWNPGKEFPTRMTQTVQLSSVQSKEQSAADCACSNTQPCACSHTQLCVCYGNHK